MSYVSCVLQSASCSSLGPFWGLREPEVIGTSLSVYPFADLPREPPGSCIKVLMNREDISEFGFDISLLGDCDEHVQELVPHLEIPAGHSCVGIKPHVHLAAATDRANISCR